MFGFSFAELIVVLLVAFIFIKPQDLPEIAQFLGRMVYRFKHIYRELKRSLKEMEGEFGLQDLKQEVEFGIAKEKAKLAEDTTVIVDLYGNEHHVPNVKEVRPDAVPEELKQEVARLNEENLKTRK
jgi:Sec-independent protein translocase protein TatA